MHPTFARGVVSRRTRAHARGGRTPPTHRTLYTQQMLRSAHAASKSEIMLTLHGSDEDSDDDEATNAIVSKLASNKTVVETPRGSPADVDEWKRAKYMPPPEPELDEDALVGSTVSVLDVHGERVNAKVILSVGGGQYMVRSESMQFAADLATAMRCRESWIVSKKS